MTKKAARDRERNVPVSKKDKFILQVKPEDAPKTREEIWKDITKANPNPRVQIIKSRDGGNLLFIPDDELSKKAVEAIPGIKMGNSTIKPRIIVYDVQTDMKAESIKECLTRIRNWLYLSPRLTT